MGLICLICGIIWSGIMMLFLSGALALTRESSSPLTAILPLGMLLLVGLYIIIFGIKEIMVKHLTMTYGTEAFGVVVNIYKSEKRSKKRTELDADILLITESGSVTNRTEPIGSMRLCLYDVGDIIKVKYRKKNFYILNKVDFHTLPYNIKESLEVNMTSFDEMYGWNPLHLSVNGQLNGLDESFKVGIDGRKIKKRI